MLDVSSLVTGLNVVSWLAPSASGCSCWQSVLLAGFFGLWLGLLIGVLSTIFACSPSLRQACQRGFRAFWQVPGGPNRQQIWRGGVDLARYHLD